MKLRIAAAVLGCTLAVPAGAKVSADEAARLNADLTPLGAERAGNAAGTIPAWSGGLTRAPAGYRGAGTRYLDPYAQDRPKFTITAQNLAQCQAELTPGQIALLRKFPQSYRMPVYETRRTAANPASVYEATHRNATRASLIGNADGISEAATGIPFPITSDPREIIWNHKLRYRGIALRRWNNQFAVTPGGAYNHVRLREDLFFKYSQAGIAPRELDNVVLYMLQIVTAPPRLAGTITLVHETQDQLKEPRRAWQYNPGQRRLRRAPNVAYDNPGTGADGLRTSDQTDMYNGAMDRYTWKLVGKQELYVPYNSYAVHSDRLRNADIVKPGHINPELTRYELHRVWVVDSVVRAETRHLYQRRTFYLDEDSWSILAADVYDARSALWRVQEAHTLMAYDQAALMPALETVYDLHSGRYLAQALNNEDEETHVLALRDGDFDPGVVIKQAPK